MYLVNRSHDTRPLAEKLKLARVAPKYLVHIYLAAMDLFRTTSATLVLSLPAPALGAELGTVLEHCVSTTVEWRRRSKGANNGGATG